MYDDQTIDSSDIYALPEGYENDQYCKVFYTK